MEPELFFARTLKSSRGRMGLTQKDLASKMGRTFHWLRSLEQGKIVPAPDDASIQEFARHLEVDVLGLATAAVVSKFRIADVARAGELAEEMLHNLLSVVSVEGEERSLRRISDDAELLIERIFPQQILEGSQIPVTLLMDQSAMEFAASKVNSFAPVDARVVENVTWEGSCGYDRMNKKIFVDIKRSTLGNAEMGDARSRFAIAHEIGHAFLHQSELEQRGTLFFDEFCSVSSALDLRRATTCLELQANAWALAFLMPSRSVARFMKSSWFSTEAMAEHFGVTPKAARIRFEFLASNYRLKEM